MIIRISLEANEKVNELGVLQKLTDSDVLRLQNSLDEALAGEGFNTVFEDYEMEINGKVEYNLGKSKYKNIQRVINRVEIHNPKCLHCLAYMKNKEAITIGCPICLYYLSPEDEIMEIKSPVSTVRNILVNDLLNERGK